jgi:hypothetical protein
MLESAVDVLTIINITPVACVKGILARHGTLMVVQMLGVDAQPGQAGRSKEVLCQSEKYVTAMS